MIRTLVISLVLLSGCVHRGVTNEELNTAFADRDAAIRVLTDVILAVDKKVETLRGSKDGKEKEGK